MTKVHHYILPLEAMIETMMELPELVSLHASLPPTPSLLPEPCVTHVIVGKGKLYSCTIARSTGPPLIVDQEAYLLLQRYGDLEWTLEPVLSPVNQKDPFPQEEPRPRQMSPPVVYRRQKELTGAELQALPHAHKLVFALVNGTNPVEKIAHLLRKSSEEVHHLLHDLQVMHLISHS